MTDCYGEDELAQGQFMIFDETFSWVVPDDVLSAFLINELIRQTGNNQHLHIYKFLTFVSVLAKHKERNEVLFLLPNKECALVHLTSPDAQLQGDELHFIFFSNCGAALKYITKQYEIEYLGEKNFVLLVKDKIEIFIFLIQLLSFFIIPITFRAIPTIILGLILYIMILFDWKSSGFNLLRDKKLYHSKVIPLLKYQIIYILIISACLLIGILVTVLSKLVK